MKMRFNTTGKENATDIAALLARAGLVLRLTPGADPASEVNGNIWCQGNVCEVEIYEQDEAPTDTPGAFGRHKSTVKKPALMPTRAEFETKLRAAGKIA